MRPYTTFDRTPNFEGDAYIAEFREVSNGAIPQREAGTYYRGIMFPGNFMNGQETPNFSDPFGEYRYFRVVKTKLVVTFQNPSNLPKSVGILPIPEGYDTEAELPDWTGSKTPMEQPKCVYTKLGPGGSSRDVRTLRAMGGNLSAAGDLVNVTQGNSDIATDGTQNAAPEAPWYFYLFQGAASAEPVEPVTGAMNYTITAYRTIKFFGRRLADS